MEEEQLDMFKKSVKVFSASWCQACGPVKASLLTLELEGLIELEYLDTDSKSGAEAAKEHSVRGIPTAICEDGSRKVGAVSIGELREWLS